MSDDDGGSGHSGSGEGGSGRGGPGGDWFAGYAGRVTELLEEAARVNARLAGQWRERSLADDEWSVDTVTADLIEAWEHLTPLAGQGLELWLEMIQRATRPGGPS